MARLFTIDTIEGNSNLGNPVFSNYGKMQNYQYLCLSPVKTDVQPGNVDENGLAILTADTMQFKIQKSLMDGRAGSCEPTLGTFEQKNEIIKILVSFKIIVFVINLCSNRKDMMIMAKAELHNIKKVEKVLTTIRMLKGPQLPLSLAERWISVHRLWVYSK
jgi:hypothetical protein